MPDPERPAGDASARVVPLRGGRRGPSFTSLLPPGDVARRLAALERQVEQALAAAGGATGATPLLESALDEVLGAYSRVRRWLAGEEGGSNPVAEASLQAFYRFWWRVDAIGLERVPAQGRVLVVANRAGTLLPYEAVVLARALGPERFEGRPAEPFVDEWLFELPLVSAGLRALGAQPASGPALRHVLEADALAIAFPEGPDAVAKPFSHRYRLAAFARGPIFRLAIETGTPIVPVAVIGSEEVHPVLFRAERLGRTIGMPAMPITPALLPLPTKWTLHIGEPVDVPGRHTATAAKDPKAVRGLREQVRERLQGLVSDGLRRRRGIFT